MERKSYMRLHSLLVGLVAHLVCIQVHFGATSDSYVEQVVFPNIRPLPRLK